MLLNCGVGEDSRASLGLQGEPTSPFWSPGCSLEGMMLKLKLQYFSHLMQSWLIGKDSDVGRDWGQEEKGTTEDEMAGWHHRLDEHDFEWTPRLVIIGRPGMLQFMESQRVGHDWATELSDWRLSAFWTDHQGKSWKIIWRPYMKEHCKFLELTKKLIFLENIKLLIIYFLPL